MTKPKSLPTSPEALRKSVREDILASGLPLEIHVTSLLEQKGWTVANQVPYYDQDEGKRRTTDIIGYNTVPVKLGDKPVFFTISLVIECKHSKNKPWVFYTRPKPTIPILSFFEHWMSHFFVGKFEVSERQALARIFTEGHFFTSEFPNIGIVHHVCFGTRDLAYEALFQAVKAVKYMQGKDDTVYGEIGSRAVHIYYPVVVFDGSMFQTVLSGEELDVKPVTYLQYEFCGSMTGQPEYRANRYIVDVVTKSGLPEYLGMLQQELKRFETHPR